MAKTTWRYWYGGPEGYTGRAHAEVGRQGDGVSLACGRLRSEGRSYVIDGEPEQDRSCPDCWSSVYWADRVAAAEDETATVSKRALVLVGLAVLAAFGLGRAVR